MLNTRRQSAGKSYAYILGVFLGDGCASGGMFRLNTIDEDFAIATKTELLKLIPDAYINIRKEVVKKSSKSNYSLSYCSTEFSRKLLKETSSKTIIPKWILASRKEVKLAFIAGLMDSEGWVKENKNNPTNRRFHMGYKSCDAFIDNFKQMLESVGVKTGKLQIEIPRQPHYKVPKSFTIKMQSWYDAGCYFRIMRKESRVKEYVSHGAYEQRSRHPRRLTSETTR